MMKSGWKPSIRELYGKHDTPIAVLGGAPSLPEDLKKLPDCITIACNQHAYLLGLRPDYYTFFHLNDRILEWYRKDADAVVLTKQSDYTDYVIDDDHYMRGFIGHFGLWLACKLTSAEVILCGMDCYSGEAPYFHDQDHSSMKIGSVPLQNYLRQWNLAKGEHGTEKGVDNPDRVYSMSGPLTEIFKPYI